MSLLSQPPLLEVAKTAHRTFIRFPFVLSSSLAAAGTAHYRLETERPDAVEPLLMALVMGVSLFFALRMLEENRSWSGGRRITLSVIGLAALAAYALTVPVPMKRADLTRFLLLAAGLHLWVAFAPFVGRRGRENAFWQYNKTLFLRFATAALYSVVLYVGLSLSLAAIDILFRVDVHGDTYFKLWFWVVFGFNTWFFLAGIPKSTEALEEEREYPAGLRMFTQYLLVPLVSLYLVILYIYLAKIVIAWSLPQGWVGYPVIGASVTAILALLLVHPIRERAENAWIVTYGRWFYWALFPLIGLMAVAIGVRIRDYGITENRYIVAVLTAWLFVIAGYFTLFSRRASIRVIPTSLCAVVLLSALGPWSAAAVARRSQLHRLESILRSNQVFTEAGLTDTDKDVSPQVARQVTDIVRYLAGVHGLDAIRRWYAEPEALPAELDSWTAMRKMGVEYRTGEERRAGFGVGSEPLNPLPLQGFDLLYELSQSAQEDGHLHL